MVSDKFNYLGTQSKIIGKSTEIIGIQQQSSKIVENLGKAFNKDKNLRALHQ